MISTNSALTVDPRLVTRDPSRGWRSAAGRASFGFVLLASVALIAFQALWHGHLSGLDEYDDGVYFAASDNLVHGLLPYRDYALIQPPFIVWLLSPLALLARFTGTALAFEAARVLLCAVAVANVALTGWLLRSRSRPEAVLAMAVMAFYPGAYRSAQTVLLEPVLTLLCLLALLALFDGDRIAASPTRHWLAGALLGVAVSTKIWALVPLAVVVLGPWLRATVAAKHPAAPRVLLAASGAFAVVCAPLAAFAPWTFVRSVFVVQAMRSASGYSRPTRAFDLTGARGLVSSVSSAGWAQTVVKIALGIVGAVLITTYVRLRRSAPRSRPLDRIAIWTAALTTVAFLVAPMYYYHYSGFLAPFLALACTRVWVVLCAGGPGPAADPLSGERSDHRPPLRACLAGSVAATALVIVVAAVAVSDGLNVARASAPAHASATFRRSVPTSACVLYLDPSLGLLADRFTASRAGCPHVIDYFGAERLLNNGSFITATTPPKALEQQLQDWVDASDVIVTGTAPPSWGPTIERRVRQQFRRQATPQAQAIMYVRRVPRA